MRTPAEAFHPSVFITEEMEARGWDRQDLVARMGGDAFAQSLALAMYLDLGPDEPGIRLGDMADDIGQAFGVSGDIFTGLERYWLDWKGEP
jgi:hypothetical protein